MSDKKEAKDCFVKRVKEVNALLDGLKEKVLEVRRHVVRRGASWAIASDLEHTRDLLIDALAFLSGKSAHEIEEDLVDKMQEGKSA